MNRMTFHKGFTYSSRKMRMWCIFLSWSIYGKRLWCMHTWVFSRISELWNVFWYTCCNLGLAPLDEGQFDLTFVAAKHPKQASEGHEQRTLGRTLRDVAPSIFSKSFCLLRCCPLPLLKSFLVSHKWPCQDKLPSILRCGTALHFELTPRRMWHHLTPSFS